MTVDLTTWTGIAATGTALVGLIKRFVPAIAGKEPLVALAVGMALAALAKVAGLGWGDLTWPELLIAGVTSGIGAGVVHDKVTNPLLGKS